MKKLFSLYVWLNLTRIAELLEENLGEHMEKRAIQTGRLFSSSSLTQCTNNFIALPSDLIIYIPGLQSEVSINVLPTTVF